MCGQRECHHARPRATFPCRLKFFPRQSIYYLISYFYFTSLNTEPILGDRSDQGQSMLATIALLARISLPGRVLPQPMPIVSRPMMSHLTPDLQQPHISPMLVHALRLQPGEDLCESLVAYCQKYGLSATTVSIISPISCMIGHPASTMRPCRMTPSHDTNSTDAVVS